MAELLKKSHISLGKIYFWTATIHKWYWLLEPVESKELIITYLKNLSDKGLITIYAFVIMPNHIHMIFRQNKLNGQETPKGSFLKYTGHLFLKQLKQAGKADPYRVRFGNKSYQIWQRDAFGVEIYSRHIARQKIEYIHVNPVKGIWKLAKDDISYYYSSALFYENGQNDFGFLNNLYWIFDGD